MDCSRILRLFKKLMHPVLSRDSQGKAGSDRPRYRDAAILAGLALSAGCVPTPSMPVATNPSPSPVVIKSMEKADDAQKRQPQASTCVAFGDFNLKAATDKERQPLQKERLFDQARRAYQQALKSDPKNRPAYEGLARTYQEMGDYNHCVETYESALKAFPRDASFLFDLGMCHARQKEWTPALEDLNAAIEIDPENRTYLNMAAYTLARAGQYEESYACFKRIVSEPEAHYNVARMLHHVKEDDLCKEHLKQALAAKSDFAPAQQLLMEIENPGSANGKAIVAVGFETIDDAPSAAPTAHLEGFHPGGD
jgi:tetratricopeptide (TPR) repeat protein